MPRGKPPKQTIAIRIDPELVAEFRSLVPKGNFSAAIDEGLRLWIARERRWQKEGKPSTSRGSGYRPPKPVSTRTAATQTLLRALLNAVATQDREDEDAEANDPNEGQRVSH